MSSINDGERMPVGPFIDGVIAQSASDGRFDAINPSTGKQVLSIPAGCEADADRAAMSARRAFDDGRWSEALPSLRKKVLHRFADLIASESAVLDRLDAEEMGKPISTAAFNAAGAAEMIRFNAEAIDKIHGDTYSSDRHSFVVQRRVPRGVVAAVVPWNFPTANAALKIGPALAGGNCVVLKPSELASRSAVRLGQLATQAGLPEGVLNVLPGRGEIVGRALALHGAVDMVAFTGSTEVGKLMLEYAGQSNMKVVQAECGGKSPQIVFADGVDLDEASASIAGFLVTNQGQICSVGSRLLVHRSIQEAMIEKITARMKQVVVGDALDPATTFGPLASEKQCARVMHFIGGGEQDGAKLVTGGKQVRKKSGGYFVEPTVFRDVPSASRIAQEEIFGPVLSVIPFGDEAEAITIANATRYGLSAYVWTADLSRGMRLAKAMRSLVFINAVSARGEGAAHATSWEPAGQSGIGVEGGMEGIATYMRKHLICFNHA